MNKHPEFLSNLEWERRQTGGSQVRSIESFHEQVFSRGIWLRLNIKLPNEPISIFELHVANQPLTPIQSYLDPKNEPIFLRVSAFNTDFAAALGALRKHQRPVAGLP